MAHLCKPGPGAVHGSALQNGGSLECGYRLCFAHKSLPGVETRLFFARKPNKTEAFPDRTPQKPLHHSPFPEIPSFDTTARRRPGRLTFLCPSTSRARLRWTRCTGCGACTPLRHLTPQVNCGYAFPAARPPEGWPGAPEHWYTVILRQQKQNKALVHGYPYADERKNDALSHASSKGGSRITQRPTYHAPLSCHPFL